MIITESFVFMHMHKTGGQTLNEIILRSDPAAQQAGYHYPISKIPRRSASLPIIGFVRNPWDWYVSWYAFNVKPGTQNPLFDVVSEDGRASFAKTAKNLATLGSDSETGVRMRNRLIDELPDTLEDNLGVGLTRDSVAALANCQYGYYSWLFDRMIGSAPLRQRHVGRFENLAGDFLEIIKSLQVKRIGLFQDELTKQERRNTSGRSHYSHYYDDELLTLIGEQEKRLINEFEYRFEDLRPGKGASYHPVELRDQPIAGFHKLLGRADNFLLLNDQIDTGPILEKVSKIPEKRWDESGREQRFEVHRDTQALLAVQFEGLDQDEPEYLELYSEFEEYLDQLVDYIARFYSDNGFVVRILFAKLRAGGNIRAHTDSGKSLLDCHRVHIPIVTNEGSIILVGGEEKNMRVGEMWEIDNSNTHAVTNMGEEDRIHLIIDWMPNRSGQAVAEILAEDESEKFGEQLAEADRLHQSGQIEKAEALYKEIISSDGKNVAALNLLGLLCIQSDRFEQAAGHIQLALTAKPDDAQALSNLGYALKNLGRFDDAAGSLQQSLVLAPDSAETLLDLGNVYIELQRPDDAIKSYRKAIALRPEFTEAHFNLGNAQLSISLFGSAEASFRKSLELKPGFAGAENKLRLAQQRRNSA